MQQIDLMKKYQILLIKTFQMTNLTKNHPKVLAQMHLIVKKITKIIKILLKSKKNIKINNTI